MLVIKFGGTSVANADRILLATRIVAEHRRHAPVTVVVSAPAGVTDALLRMTQAAITQRHGWRDDLAWIEMRHREAYLERIGSVSPVFEAQWEALLADLAQLTRHVAAGDERAVATAARHFSGWGERLSVVLFARSLAVLDVPAHYLTEEPVLLEGSIDDADPAPAASLLATRAWLTPRLTPWLLSGSVPVLPGYIARDAAGHSTTLGRNGSDYSAAIIAAALGATALYIYSDVPGVYTADPNRHRDAVLYPHLTYAEAAAIAAGGAKVLHPRAIEPLMRSAIPLYLRSTLTPEATGTNILPAGVA